MDYNLFNINKLNEYFYEDYTISDDLFKDILTDNLLKINSNFLKPSKDIWEILSIGIFNSDKHSKDIKNKYNNEIDYIENNMSFSLTCNLFDNINIENILDKISILYNVNCFYSNINLKKYNLYSKIFGKRSNKLIHLLVYKNKFYNLIDINDNSEKNGLIKDVSRSTFNDSKEINIDLQDNNTLSECENFYLYLTGKKFISNHLPYNNNLLENKGYLKLITQWFPKEKSDSYTMGIREMANDEITFKRDYGYLKFFDMNKSFGFFQNESDNQDIFVHIDDLKKIQVNFDLLTIPKKKLTLRFSYWVYEYFGKYNKSKKAIDISLESIKIK